MIVKAISAKGMLFSVKSTSFHEKCTDFHSVSFWRQLCAFSMVTIFIFVENRFSLSDDQKLKICSFFEESLTKLMMLIEIGFKYIFEIESYSNLE